MPMLEVSNIKNLTQISQSYHAINNPFQITGNTWLHTTASSYLRKIFNIIDTDNEQTTSEKLHASAEKPKALIDLTHSLYHRFAISIEPKDKVETEIELFRYLVHYLIRKLSGTQLELDTAILNNLLRFINELLSIKFDPVDKINEFIEYLQDVRSAVMDFAFQNSTMIAQTLQLEVTKLQSTIARLNADVKALQAHNQISSKRAGDQGFFNSESSSSTSTNSRNGSTQKQDVGLVMVGSMAIIEATNIVAQRNRWQVFDYDTMLQINAWLVAVHRYDAVTFKDSAINTYQVCDSLRTVLSSLRTKFFDNYKREADREEALDAHQDLTTLWDDVWQDGKDSEQGSLRQMINRTIIMKKADELNNTPPEINLEKLIVQVLTRAISIVNDMLGVVKIPQKADARNWWAYLFAYRSMLFAIVRLYEPDKVAKNKNGAKVEPPDANILTKAWAYTKNTGKVLEMIESMLTLYHRKELARRTESNVALPRAYILLDAHKAVLEDQAMRPLENYHMSRK